MIFIDAVRISVDVDLNTADSLLSAKPVFQVAETRFCLFFTTELLVRLMAFRRKRHVLKDKWFLFDSMLVVLMVFDTWMFSQLLLITGTSYSGGISKISICSG